MGRRSTKFVDKTISLDEIVKRKGTAPKRDNVLHLTEWLYIVPDAHCWMVKEVCPNGIDRTLLYFSTLAEAIKGCMRRCIRIPADIIELQNRVDSLYSLIDARIPPDIKPKDLFTFEEES